MSSSRPGASPTNMMRACGLPSANTSRVAVFFSAQPSKFSSSARSASSVGAVRAASRAIAMAASGGGAVSLRGTAGVAAGVSRNGRGGAVSPDRGGGGWGVGLAQPIDRLLRQRAIDPGLQIKGQQLPEIRRGFGDQIHYANLIWIGPA